MLHYLKGLLAPLSSTLKAIKFLFEYAKDDKIAKRERKETNTVYLPCGHSHIDHHKNVAGRPNSNA
jgi:hypothetical protein